jgi:pimeloyl-ACP methyl ester carboxylesterase
MVEQAEGVVNETHAYLEHEGEQIYVARHVPPGTARAIVVLVSAIALERTHAHLTWVRWARSLSAAGFDVIRFDMRGMGESSGAFASMTWDAWTNDVVRVVEHARSLQQKDVPLAVHGLRGGALLAARAFAAGLGDRLMMWEPPRSARELMVEMLRRKLATDYAENTGTTKRKTRAEYVAELENGSGIEVEGHAWSGALWKSAESIPLAVPASGEPRPWLSVRVPRPHFWLESKVLRAPLDELFDSSIGFLDGGAK